MAIRNQFLETVVGSPPAGWTLGHVTICLSYPSERIPVEAWRRGAFGVHQTENPDGARVTHAPTGLLIWQARSMDEAAEFCERIEPLADWNAITKVLDTNSDIYPKVREVRFEFESRETR